MIAKDPETTKPQANKSPSTVYFLIKPRPIKGQVAKLLPPATTRAVPAKAAATRAVVPTKEKATATHAVAPKRKKAAAKCNVVPKRQKADSICAIAPKKDQAVTFPFAGFFGGKVRAVQGGANAASACGAPIQEEWHLQHVQGGAEVEVAKVGERQGGCEGGGTKEGEHQGRCQGKSKEGGHKNHQKVRPLFETALMFLFLSKFILQRST